MPAKTFTMSVDDKFDKVLDELKKEFGKPSKAEVMRFAVSLLKVAKEARDSGRHLCITDADNKIIERILLPA